MGKTLQDKIDVMRAFQDGKPVEFRNIVGQLGTWRREWAPNWDWSCYDYRVMPPNRLRYINYYPFPGVRATHNSEEAADEAMDPELDCVRIEMDGNEIKEVFWYGKEG